jgi:hypothetical protein
MVKIRWWVIQLIKLHALRLFKFALQKSSDGHIVQYFAVPPKVHMDSSGLYPKKKKDYLWYASRVWVRVRVGLGFRVRGTLFILGLG